MITEPGLYFHVPESSYHADNDLAPTLGRSLSVSGAKTILHSPARFVYERDHGSTSSPAMDFGTLVHALTLDSGDTRIVVSPHAEFRSKEAKEWKAEQSAAGKVVVTEKDHARATEIAAAVHAHPIAGKLLAEGEPEVSMYWIDPATSITCRGRVDWLAPTHIADVKTVGRAGGSEPGPFARQAANLDYPMSAAHYIDGYATLTGMVLPFYTIAVEVEAPYWVRVSEYRPRDLEKGRDRMGQAAAVFAERESQWDGWNDPPEIEILDVPSWYGRT